jgi:RNA polymerase sigma-70 factor (ECF subfamily)
MAAGDEQAFVALYHRRHGQMYRFAYQVSGSREIAEESVQEAFLGLIRSAGEYDPAKGSLLSWLYGAARNQVLRRLQRDRRYLPLEEVNDELPLDERLELGTVDTVLDHLTRSERLNAVQQAVMALPLHYREVVVLCDLQEMSYEEAAKALECVVGTVRSRLHRARGLLAERLRPRVRCEL